MQISPFPSSAQMPQMHQRLFQQADVDGDGSLTLDEFKSIGKNAPADAAKTAAMPSAEDMFTKLDSNGDGKLSTEKMEPPKPKFDAASMTLLLQVQSETQNASQTSDTQDPDDVQANDVNPAFGKLSQLLESLMKGLDQTGADQNAVNAIA